MAKDVLPCGHDVELGEAQYLDHNGVKSSISGEMGILQHSTCDWHVPCGQLQLLTQRELNAIRIATSALRKRSDGMSEEQRAYRSDLVDRLNGFITLYKDYSK